MLRTVVISGGSRGLGAILTKAFLTGDNFNVAIVAAHGRPLSIPCCRMSD